MMCGELGIFEAKNYICPVHFQHKKEMILAYRRDEAVGRRAVGGIEGYVGDRLKGT